MAPPNESPELLAAWRALGGGAQRDGWLTIPVAAGGLFRLMAGRHFPDNAEALLVNFPSVRVPSADRLPQGHGFRVAKAELGGPEGATGSWVALSRQPAGSLDLFAMMANDIIATVRGSTAGEEALFQLFLARIRAWQDFMGRNGGLVLGAEAEVGLIGELELLENLLVAGVPGVAAVGAWQGPLGGIHDFVFGPGAIEVKSTVSAGGFPATVSSLEQLDDSLISPLYLCAFRLAIDPAGITLPSKVAHLRERLRGDATARIEFDNRLVRVGFFDAWTEGYVRRFVKISNRLLVVNADFPRLVRANVGMAIRRARYEIDLDMITVATASLSDGLSALGVT